MRKSIKATVGIAGAALLVAGLGFSASTATAQVPAKSSSSIPSPVAAVPNLKGGNTAVALDANFLAALKSLGVTPGCSAQRR